MEGNIIHLVSFSFFQTPRRTLFHLCVLYYCVTLQYLYWIVLLDDDAHCVPFILYHLCNSQ